MTSSVKRWKSYVINLDKRKDRWDHMQKFFSGGPQNTLFDIVRYRAYYHERGHLGCTLSHIGVLEDYYDSHPQQPYYFVFEDDFWVIPEKMKEWEDFLEAFMCIQDSSKWDMILLTPRRRDSHNDGLVSDKEMLTFSFERISRSLTTTGYIIKRDYIPKYLEALQESAEKLSAGSKEEYEAATVTHCADVIWHKLQLKDNFYAYQNVFAAQLPGFSDIANTNVNYTRLFLERLPD